MRSRRLIRIIARLGCLCACVSFAACNLRCVFVCVCVCVVFHARIQRKLICTYQPMQQRSISQTRTQANKKIRLGEGDNLAHCVLLLVFSACEDRPFTCAARTYETLITDDIYTVKSNHACL